MFIGQYVMKCDEGGRCAVPARLLSAFGGRDTELYILDCGDHLELWDAGVFDVAGKPETEPLYLRRLYSQIHRIEAGSKGRIRIPFEFLETIGGAGQDVSVLGCGDHIEIWEKDAETE